MRKIKFRAWVKDENKMLYGLNATINGYFTPSFRYRKSEIELMQYTGLNDSKRTEEYHEGQEIYEGDIVEYHIHIGDYYKSTPVTKRKVVVWDERSASFRYQDLVNKGAEKQKMHTVHLPVVIGNIYENPELLN